MIKERFLFIQLITMIIIFTISNIKPKKQSSADKFKTILIYTAWTRGIITTSTP
ncbi:hypothetical protein BN1088_1433042 [Sphingobacterium sp. PM2-P1-29]|nr:hypothetical protein BN1088_1433042 [Sphingobacterium sp. PM2-P1-29]